MTGNSTLEKDTEWALPFHLGSLYALRSDKALRKTDAEVLDGRATSLTGSTQLAVDGIFKSDSNIIVSTLAKSRMRNRVAQP